jgi:hypothetical protein
LGRFWCGVSCRLRDAFVVVVPLTEPCPSSVPTLFAQILHHSLVSSASRLPSCLPVRWFSMNRVVLAVAILKPNHRLRCSRCCCADLGAAYGTAKSGVGIASMGVLRYVPRPPQTRCNRGELLSALLIPSWRVCLWPCPRADRTWSSVTSFQ